MPIILAFVSFFLFAPIIGALQKGLQPKYIFTIIILIILFFISCGLFPTTIPYNWLLWIIAAVIPKLAKADFDKAKQNKKILKLVYGLAIVFAILIFLLALSSYN